MAAGAHWVGMLAISSLVTVLCLGGMGTPVAGPASSPAAGGYGPFALAHPMATTTTNTTSTVWAGYNILPASGTGVTDVQAGWTVPALSTSCSGATQYASFFVGIAGTQSGVTTVEVIGTQANCSSGSASYSGFYELSTAGSVYLGLKIHSGDRMHGEVFFNTTSKKFTATLKDFSTGKKYFHTQAVSGAVRGAAVWIASAVSIGGFVQPLANFGSVVFTNASATISGHTHSISGWNNYLITMMNTAGTKVKASVGTLKSSGSKFTVTWKSAGP